MKHSSLVAKRYACALLDLAEETKAVESVEKDVVDIQAMLEASEDFDALFTSPSFGENEQLDAINALAAKGKFHTLTTNFLGVLVQNRRTQDIAGIVQAFFQESASRKGTVDVQVQVAQDLSAAQLKDLQDSLKKGLGHDVSIEAKVEPGIIGGLIVTVGSFMVDHSVRRKLERLGIAMGGHSNQNFNATKKEA